MTTTFVRARIDGPRRYLVQLGGVTIGEVVAVALPSHIRRGRTQVSPWWQAYRHGQPVGDRQQRRLDAANELVR